MSVRNRGKYTNFESAPSGGMGFLRQALLVLFMGALSFFLGFFVLARLWPIGHSPDMPVVRASSTPIESTPPPIKAQPITTPAPNPVVTATGPTTTSTNTPNTPNTPPASGPSLSSSPAGLNTAAPTTSGISPKGPTIDPEGGDAAGGTTQPAAGLDDAKPAPPSDNGVNAAGSTVPAPKHSTHRRRRRRRTPPPPAAPAATGEQTPSGVDGDKPVGAPPPTDPGDQTKPTGGDPSGGAQDKGGQGGAGGGQGNGSGGTDGNN